MAYEPMLPALAKAVSQAFPELQGRALAVSEVAPFNDKTNVPSLPIAYTALIGESSNQTSRNTKIDLVDRIMVALMFDPVKYQREGGEDTAFFAFYDYESIRDRMLMLAKHWETPRGGGLVYKTMDVESDEFAVYINFVFEAHERWSEDCVAQPDDDCQPPIPAPTITMVSRVLQPEGCCPPLCEEPEATDGCEAARLQNPHGKEAANSNQ